MIRPAFRLAAAAALLATQTSCAAVLVGALAYDHIESRRDRREFAEDFSRKNIEREKAGLKPLDWCTELRNFKPGWAADDPRCRAAAVEPKQ